MEVYRRQLIATDTMVTITPARALHKPMPIITEDGQKNYAQIGIIEQHDFLDTMPPKRAKNSPIVAQFPSSRPIVRCISESRFITNFLVE
jgi:hypothetical protein